MVNTSFIASTKPLKLVTADGRQHDEDAEHRQRVQEDAADRERAIANGTSRLGLVISSPALLGSSKPT